MLQAIGDATAEKIFAVDGIRYAVGVWNYVLCKITKSVC